MKIWIISDTHFGKYTADSDKWLKLMTSYFYDWFIPTVKSKVKKGDVLVHCGDLFDNRNSINVKVIDSVVKLFEDLSEIFGEIHLISGNHDSYAMSSSEINSACVIRNIHNVHVHDKPTRKEWNGKSVVLMPWVHGKRSEQSILEQFSGADVLFCHSDLNGCRTQLNPTRPLSRHILDVEDFGGFKKVFSGHIHIRQTINNFTFVGAPYHLDRNDVDNEKGIYVYDTKTGKELFIPNDHSPKFKKISVSSEIDLKNLAQEEFDKNFIDLHVSKSFMSTDPKNRLKLEKIANQWNVNEVFWVNDILDKKTEIVKATKSVNADRSILEWSKSWIDELKFSDSHDMFSEIELKDLMNQQVEKCFEIIRSGS